MRKRKKRARRRERERNGMKVTQRRNGKKGTKRGARGKLDNDMVKKSGGLAKMAIQNGKWLKRGTIILYVQEVVTQLKILNRTILSIRVHVT